MMSALSTALAGLRNAASDADLAARKIAAAGAADASSDAAPAVIPTVIDATGTAPRDDLLQGVFDFQAAAIACKANAKTFASAGDMEKMLIDGLR